MRRGADRLSLLGRATAVLRERGIPFAVIGAAAMAVHGVSRATRDLDLLAVGPAALEPDTWRDFRATGVEVQIRRGDADDPLAGVVRLSAVGEDPIDLVVGKAAWQADLLGRATESRIEDVGLPVVDRAGLVLLKLYAGGLRTRGTSSSSSRARSASASPPRSSASCRSCRRRRGISGNACATPTEAKPMTRAE